MFVHLYEGIAYNLGHVNASEQGLSFQVDMYQAFQPWCELQTPIPNANGYRCRQNWGGGVDRTETGKQCWQLNPATQQRQGDDCLAIWLCSMETNSGCVCTDSECYASSEARPIVAAFDLALDEAGDTLSGGHSFTPAGSLGSLPMLVGPFVQFRRQ
jgi:hypothetical protein